MRSTCASSVCTALGYAPTVVANSVTRTGWTVGGGIETVLWTNWLARAEYRYADFGDAAMSITRSSTIPGLNPTIESFTVALRTHTATFGLAYKLN